MVVSCLHDPNILCFNLPVSDPSVLPVLAALLIAGVAGLVVVIGVGVALVSRSAKREGPPDLDDQVAELRREVQELQTLPATWERIAEEMREQGVVLERNRRRVAARESREKRESAEAEAQGPPTREDVLRAAWARRREMRG